VTFPILRIFQRALTVTVHRSSRKLPLILARFKRTLHFLDIFSKKYSSINFHKNLSSRSRVVHADGQTDRQTKKPQPVVAFHNFSKSD